MINAENSAERLLSYTVESSNGETRLGITDDLVGTFGQREFEEIESIAEVFCQMTPAKRVLIGLLFEATAVSLQNDLSPISGH